MNDPTKKLIEGSKLLRYANDGLVETEEEIAHQLGLFPPDEVLTDEYDGPMMIDKDGNGYEIVIMVNKVTPEK